MSFTLPFYPCPSIPFCKTLLIHGMRLDRWKSAICMGQNQPTSGNFMLLQGVGNLEPHRSPTVVRWAVEAARRGQQRAERAQLWSTCAAGAGARRQPPLASSWALILSQVGFPEGAAAFHIHLCGGSKALEAGNHWLRQPAFGFIYFLCWFCFSFHWFPFKFLLFLSLPLY